MNRASFLAILGALPLVGGLFREDPREKWVGDKVAEERARLYAINHNVWSSRFYWISEDGVYVVGPDEPLHKISDSISPYKHGKPPFVKFDAWPT